MSLNIVDVEPVITNEGSTHLVLVPRSLRGTLDASPSMLETTGLLSDIRPRILDGSRRLECVPFAREESGIAIRGNANRWWQLAAGRFQRTKHPEAGSVFVMRGYSTSRRGHVAVVKQILDERTIVVDHANWGNDGRIYLQAPIRDLSPKNDWSRVQVWYTPKNQWGQRVYRAKGFILPTSAVAGGTGDRAMTPLLGTN